MATEGATRSSNRVQSRQRRRRYWARQPLSPRHPRWDNLSKQQKAAVRAANRVMGGAVKAGDFFGPKKTGGFFGKDPFKPAGKKKKGGGGNRPKGGGSHSGHGHKSGGGGGGSRKGGRKGGGSGKGVGSTPGMSYRGMGRPPSTPRSKAKIIVGHEINRQLRELGREARKTKRSGKRGVEDIKDLFQKTRGDLDYLYNEADDAIGAQNEQINDRYVHTQQRLGDIFGQLQSGQEAQTQEARSQALAEMMRLGVADPNALGQFDADASMMQQIAAQQQANNMANLQTQRMGSNEIGDMLQAMAQGSRAQQQGMAKVARQEGINEVRGDTRDQLMDILDGMREVRAGRGAAVNELHTAMQQNAFQQWAEMQQMNFQNSLAASQFNLDVDKFRSDNLWKKAKARQEAKKAATKRRLAARERAVQSVTRRIMDQANNMNPY